MLISGIHYYDTMVYRYGDEKKVVYLKRFQADEYHLKREFENSNELVGNKFMSNLSRAKSTVLAYALCNEWDYFCTFTLDEKKYVRSDLEKWVKDFSQWIRNQRRLIGDEWRYVLIPEWHIKNTSDGLRAWHLHGIIKGCLWDKLEEFVPGIHPWKLCNENYRWHKGLTEKFGFNSFGKIRSKERVSRYILKYITKSMAQQNEKARAHLFYASHGLNKPELIKQGVTVQYPEKVDFKNDFMATAWLSDEDYWKVLKNLY